jgi:F-box and WD-40 domain protein CDC4
MSELLRQWEQVQHPVHTKIKIPHPPNSVPAITCLLFSNGRIIAAADSASIYVYLADTGRLLHTLNGHQGGVWALKLIDETLVSASTDKTIRVWDLFGGRCLQIYSGHQNTIRCLEIVEPSWNIFPDPKTGVNRKESWPSRPYLLSGGRDCTVRLWALPRQTDPVDSKKVNSSTQRHTGHTVF